MTRKHYVGLARVLKGERCEHFETKTYDQMTAWEKGTYDLWHTTAHNIAHYLAQDNPRFDRARFLTAAGVQS